MTDIDIGRSFDRGRGAGGLLSGVMQLARLGIEIERNKASQEHRDFLESESRKRTEFTRQARGLAERRFTLTKEESILKRASTVATEEARRTATGAFLDAVDQSFPALAQSDEIARARQQHAAGADKEAASTLDAAVKATKTTDPEFESLKAAKQQADTFVSQARADRKSVV